MAVKKLIHKILFLFAILSLSFAGVAQDVQFTQFYAAPLLLNPAFTGATNKTRLITNNRIQWVGLNGVKSFNTFSAGVDHYFKQYKSGVGLMAVYNTLGSSQMTSIEITGLYSFHVKLNDRWNFIPGLQLSYVSRSVDFSKLLFGDQISKDGTSSVSQDFGSDKGRAGFFDFGAGGLIYEKKFWFGLAVHHINTPNQSFGGAKSPLPIKYSIHGGYKFEIKPDAPQKSYGPQRKPVSISPAFNFKSQGNFTQLDLGFYTNFDPVVFGFWYRGIPVIKTYESNINSDAMAILVGLRFDDHLHFGYSYDFTVSSLKNTNSGGTHELSLSTAFEYKSPRKKKDYSKMELPSPEF